MPCSHRQPENMQGESKLLLSSLKINQGIIHPQEKRGISKIETKIKKKRTYCSSFESLIFKPFLLILNYQYSHSICPLVKELGTIIFCHIFLCRYGKHPAAEWRKKNPNTKTQTNNSPPPKLINRNYSTHQLFVPSSCKNRASFSFRKKKTTEGKNDKHRSPSLASCKVLTVKLESLAKWRQTELRTEMKNELR